MGHGVEVLRLIVDGLDWIGIGWERMSNEIIGDDGEIFSFSFGGNGEFSKKKKKSFGEVTWKYVHL